MIITDPQYKNATIDTQDRARETDTQGDRRPLNGCLPRMVNQIQDFDTRQPALLLIMASQERHRSSRDERIMPSETSSNVREWAQRDRNQGYDTYRRGRSPSPRGRNGGYRDRDREGYRSSGYDSRSRSPSPRRDKVPYYGGPPSREVILEGLPLEMTEEDVPTPTNPFTAHSSKIINSAA